MLCASQPGQRRGEREKRRGERRREEGEKGKEEGEKGREGGEMSLPWERLYQKLAPAISLPYLRVYFLFILNNFILFYFLNRTFGSLCT